MSEWISVKDGLPPAYESVLFYIELPWVRGKKGFCVVSDGSDGTVYRYNFVTHWMPLPTPPSLLGSKTPDKLQKALAYFLGCVRVEE